MLFDDAGAFAHVGRYLFAHLLLSGCIIGPAAAALLVGVVHMNRGCEIEIEGLRLGKAERIGWRQIGVR